VLDTEEWYFQQAVEVALAKGSGVSQLRIQNVEVTYTMDATFVIATLLGEVPPISETFLQFCYSYFTLFFFVFLNVF
jgi:hypothetical protein